MRTCNEICPICGKRCNIVDPEKGDIPGIPQAPFDSHEHHHFIFEKSEKSRDVTVHRWNDDTMTTFRVHLGKAIDKKTMRRTDEERSTTPP